MRILYRLHLPGEPVFRPPGAVREYLFDPIGERDDIGRGDDLHIGGSPGY